MATSVTQTSYRQTNTCLSFFASVNNSGECKKDRTKEYIIYAEVVTSKGMYRVFNLPTGVLTSIDIRRNNTMHLL